ncbi:hypothetical protein OSTOST_22455, partial [Ostertagia ostertagi]
ADCNYTCHSRCQELVTLDCRSAGSSLASGEFPSIYPKLLDGTLGTIPKELHLPPLPLNSSFGDSDKENETCFENPLFSPSKMSRAELPSSALGHPLIDQQQHEPVHGQTLRISEVYVKEDTPFEWSPAYRDDNLAQAHRGIQQDQRRPLHENKRRWRDVLRPHPNSHEPHPTDQRCCWRKTSHSVRCCEYR